MKTCPRCGKVYFDESALSRVEPHEAICPGCGIIEAMEDAGFSREDQEEVLKAARAAREKLGH